MAGRPRKPLENQSGHLTINFKEARASAEGKVKAESNGLLKKRPRELIDAKAKEMWDILTSYLLTIAFYGDINVGDAIGYCNAYSAYLSAWKTYKAAADPAEKDVCMKLVKGTSEEMTRCQNRGGFSVTTRLQIGDKEVQKEQKEIDDAFGGI